VNRFPRVIGVRLGYDPEQVDALILRIERTLGRGRLDGSPVTPDEIRGAKFGVKLGGYNETAVDFALDAFIVAVETLNSPAADLPAGEPADLDSVRQAGEEGGASARSEALGGETTSEAAPGARDEAAPGARDGAGPGTRGDAGVVEGRKARLVETGQGRKSGGAQADDGKRGAAQDERKETGRAQADAGHDRPVGAEPEDTWEAEATRVEQMAFRPGRLGLGYRERDVDALLDRVVATLRGATDQPVTAEHIRAATFTTVVFRSGYAIGEVDRFLAELAGVLERRGQGRR
jgi:DivIVA domain-containing protein